MKKTYWAALATATLLGGALALPTTAYAAPNLTCAQIGHRVYKGDADYRPSLDGDNDGVGCEAYPDRDRSSNVGSIPNRDAWCSEISRRDIPRGDAEYTSARDRDNDGIACESGNDDDFSNSPARTSRPTASPTRTTAKPSPAAQGIKDSSSKQANGGLAKTGH